MASDLEAFRKLTRALAEVRDGPFYALWVDLTHVVKGPAPRIGFRIHKVADSSDSRTAVWVDCRRADGSEVRWSLVLEAASDLTVSVGVEISDGQGTHEVFSRSGVARTAEEAVELIHAFASETCARRELAESSGE